MHYKDNENLGSNLGLIDNNYPLFSFFRKPIGNTKPCKLVSLLEVYRYITDVRLKQVTEDFRSTYKCSKEFKSKEFNYVTFSGNFSKRTATHLIHYSGYLCIDIDDVENVESTFNLLQKDENTELMFRSPSGKGIKWIIAVDLAVGGLENYYKAISDYLLNNYNIKADKACKDVARACFLCYDEHAFINPKYL